MIEYLLHLPSHILELFIGNPWGQGIGMVAFIVSIVNFYFLKDRLFIWGTLVASLAWALNFLFLGALTAAVINLFDVFKNAAALKFERSAKSMYYFIGAYSVIGILMLFGLNINTDDGFRIVFEDGYNWKSLLVTFSAIFSTYLVFKTRGVQMKLGFLLVVAAYLTYNIIFQNIGGILTDVTLGVAGLLGVYKDWRESKK